jgi:cold shock CspA family protein
MSIENGVCTFAKFSECHDGLHALDGYGFLEAADGTSLWFSSSSVYQNKGMPDNIERGDLVSFERFERPKPGRGPSCRRVWLRQKAQQAKAGGAPRPGKAHEHEQIETIAGEYDT